MAALAALAGRAGAFTEVEGGGDLTLGGLLGVRSCGCGVGCPPAELQALESALYEDSLLLRWFPNCHTGDDCSGGLEAAFGSHAACICESQPLLESFANNIRALLSLDPATTLQSYFPECDWPPLEDWMQARMPAEPVVEPVAAEQAEVSPFLMGALEGLEGLDQDVPTDAAALDELVEAAQGGGWEQEAGGVLPPPPEVAEAEEGTGGG